MLLLEIGIITLLYLIMFIVVIVFESIVLGMRDDINKSQPISVKQAPNSCDSVKYDNSVDGKIKELKHLFEIGVLTQEQYEAAVSRIIKQVM